MTSTPRILAVSGVRWGAPRHARLYRPPPAADDPDLFGIMLISFIIVQFAPGGPVQRIMAQLQGTAGTAPPRASPVAAGDFAGGRRSRAAAATRPSRYRGAQGLDRQFIKQLEVQFGFDKPAHERFLKMLRDYAHFDFGKSYFRDVSVLQLIKEKLPVSITLGLMDDASLLPISIPLGIRKAVRMAPLRRLDVRRRHRRLRHPWLPVRHPVHRSVRRRLVLADLSVARAYVEKLGRASPRLARRWIISGTSRCRSRPCRSAPSPPRRCSPRTPFSTRSANSTC